MTDVSTRISRARFDHMAATQKRELARGLANLRERVGRALDALDADEPLDAHLIANAADLATHIAIWNTLRELEPYLSPQEPAADPKPGTEPTKIYTIQYALLGDMHRVCVFEGTHAAVIELCAELTKRTKRDHSFEEIVVGLPSWFAAGECGNVQAYSGRFTCAYRCTYKHGHDGPCNQKERIS